MKRTMLFGQLAVATVAQAALAQYGGVGSLDCSVIHQNQLPSYPTTCSMEGIARDVIEFTEIEHPITTSVVSQNRFLGECGFWPCGQAPAMPLATCGFSVNNTLGWQVGGSASLQIKIGLAAGLVAELQPGGSVTRTHVGHETIGSTGSIRRPIEHCSFRDCVVENVTTRVEGRTTVWSEVASWECTQPNGLVLYLGTFCGSKSASGFAETVFHQFSFTQPFPNMACPQPCGEDC